MVSAFSALERRLGDSFRIPVPILCSVFVLCPTVGAPRMSPSFIIYGANGYTGSLIAERACERGLRPVIAGRNRDALEQLGARLGLEARVFDLSDPDAVREGLRGARLVLHCAGPYSQTSRPMVDACLRAGVSYLDITGEYAVLEAVLGRDAEAREARVVLLPAVGFDV